MNRYFVTIICLLTCCAAFAQFRGIDIVSVSGAAAPEKYQKVRDEQSRKFDEYDSPPPKYDYQSTAVTKNLENDYSDAVLYRDVVRRYSWLEGLGEPITQSVANGLPYYFRLSKKNDAGHYQLVEAMHGAELTAEHPLSTYILDKGAKADLVHSEWIEGLNTVGQWVLYPDATGELVVEERAFEAKSRDAKLVYSMHAMRNDNTHVTITYNDAFGRPADINDCADNIYGSVVFITYDANGYDSVIDYLDGAGYRKANLDDVDQLRYVYDDQGRVIKVITTNCLGFSTNESIAD